MKRLLLLALAVLAVVGAGLAAANHYKNNKSKNTPEPTVTVSQRDSAVAEAVAQEKALWVDRMNGLRLECEKGYHAYTLLSSTLQRRNASPVCGTAVIQ